MPKKLIKRFMPDHEMIKRQKALQLFGNVLYNPNLWCLNRRSASGAFAVGLFMAFVPLPSQMIMSAGLAILLLVLLLRRFCCCHPSAATTKGRVPSPQRADALVEQ